MTTEAVCATLLIMYILETHLNEVLGEGTLPMSDPGRIAKGMFRRAFKNKDSLPNLSAKEICRILAEDMISKRKNTQDALGARTKAYNVYAKRSKRNDLLIDHPGKVIKSFLPKDYLTSVTKEDEEEENAFNLTGLTNEKLIAMVLETFSYDEKVTYLNNLRVEPNSSSASDRDLSIYMEDN